MVSFRPNPKARLMYGTGLRLMECVRLRVKDVDFGQQRVYVRDGKGGKDRTTCLPEGVAGALREQIERVRGLHEGDLAEGFGVVHLRQAMDRKTPGGGREFGWQYVFPGKWRSRDPRSGEERWHHVMESGLQKAVKARPAGRDWTRKSRARHCGTVLPPICWNGA